MKTHRMSYTRLYRSWEGMKRRCNNHEKYKGVVKVCDDWLKFEPFRDWALANGYGDGLSLDRINNESGYSPDNCRWVTWKQQANNKRNNVNICYKGETHNLKEWSAIIGINYKTLWMRLNSCHYDIETAFTKKVV